MDDCVGNWLTVDESDLFTGNYGPDDGARLIAPSIPKIVQPELSEDEEKHYEDALEAALDGAYHLQKPVIDLKRRTVYSLDMVRLNFEIDNAPRFIELMDTQMILQTMTTFTSNRIGTYRFMWTFDRCDGREGGYCIEKDGEMITDGGTEGVIVKVGYGVVGKGGKANNRGFVEFNPNKCESNGRRLLELMYSWGCDFWLARYDIAMDVPLERNRLRVLRDRRKYEFIQSSKGGMTEYLGQRSNPGRVKVYDKAAEQGLDGCKLSRIEVTCDGSWNHNDVIARFPRIPDFDAIKTGGAFGVTSAVLADVTNGEWQGVADTIFPEKYLSLLKSNTRCNWRKRWAENKMDRVEPDVDSVIMIMNRAKSFVIK